MSNINTLDLRQPAPPSRPRSRRIKRRHVAWTAIGVTALALISGAAWLVWTLWLRPPDLNNIQTIKHLVGRHYTLPTGEDPALATVTDATKLQTPFLKRAHNGDKLLVYEKSGIALIYRPSIDRLVAVGPVSIAPANPAP